MALHLPGPWTVRPYLEPPVSDGPAVSEQPFPLDDATLVMLASACEINPDTGRTHLLDFLDFGSQVKTSTDISEEFGDDGPAVYLVEYEDGACPFSPHDAIKALVAEVQRLRELLP